MSNDLAAPAVRGVAHVQSKDVRTGLNELANHLGTLGGRSECGNNLGLASGHETKATLGDYTFNEECGTTVSTGRVGGLRIIATVGAQSNFFWQNRNVEVLRLKIEPSWRREDCEE